MKLKDYIKKNYKTQVEFADSLGITRQHVQKMLKHDYQVIDGWVCSKQKNSYFARKGKVYRQLLKLEDA